MPGFRNRLVLEIARGVKGFLNLEVGLTRGEVPDIGKPDGRAEKTIVQNQGLKTGRHESSLEIGPQKINRLEVFRNLLGLLPPGRLLDLACGHGKFSLVARDLGWEVTAVDVRTERMPEASGIEWVQSDVREFEIERDRYDCISLFGLLYHLELGDQLALLRKCAGTPTIVDTHVTRRTDHKEAGYRGTLFDEVSGEDLEKHDVISTASWKNRMSFWPTEESLIRMFHDSGFPQVFRLTPPHEEGRTFYLCFGDPEKEEKAGPGGKPAAATRQVTDDQRPTGNLLPPESEMFPGNASNFEKAGQEFLGHFKELGDLKPENHVLDIGCGIGRMALPLTGYLDESGGYEGFDVVRRGVEWCRNNITPQYPNFRFQVSDVHNQRYNPEGTYQASEYVFPYEDAAFDFAFLASVFTHMLPEEVDNYLSEISRVLKPGGRCLISYFLLNKESLDLIEEGRSAHDFRFGSGANRFADPERPEFAVAYDEGHILGLYEKHGLLPRGAPGYGSWCGRKEFLSYQDILVAEKDRRTA